MYVCMYVCVRVGMYVLWMYMCVGMYYVCMYMYMFMYVYVCVHMYVSVCVSMYCIGPQTGSFQSQHSTPPSLNRSRMHLTCFYILYAFTLLSCIYVGISVFKHYVNLSQGVSVSKHYVSQHLHVVTPGQLAISSWLKLTGVPYDIIIILEMKLQDQETIQLLLHIKTNNY